MVIAIEVFLGLLVIGVVVAGITAFANRRSPPALLDSAIYRVTRRMAVALEYLLVQAGR